MVVCAVICEPVSASQALLFPVICIFQGQGSLAFFLLASCTPLELCHRPKTAELRPATIASPLSSTNSRRARPAIRMGDQEKRLYSLALARWAAELPTALAPWPWTKPLDQSRFEKATRSQRYLRCRPYFERCSELLRRGTPKRDASFWRRTSPVLLPSQSLDR